MTIIYQSQFKELADRMASDPIPEWALERRVLRHLWMIDENTGKLAPANRERTIERVLAIFRGRGNAADTTGNSPGLDSPISSNKPSNKMAKFSLKEPQPKSEKSCKSASSSPP